MFSTTFRTLGARWAPILGSIVASSVIMVLVAMLLLLPAMHGLQARGNVHATATPYGTQVDPTTGMPAPDGTRRAAQSAPTSTTHLSVSGPGTGAVLKLFIAFSLMAVLGVATATTGVFAAAGMGAMEALREGARTTPQAIVQTTRIGWKGMAAYGAAILAILVLHGAGVMLALPLMLVGMVLLLQASGTMWLAIGGIAHGHVEWSPQAALDASEGRRWTATGVGIVGSLVGSLLNFIPVVGPLFISAYTSAMWEEFGGSSGHGPTGPGEAPTPIEPAAVAQVPATAVPLPAATAVPVPAPAPQLVAGPTWNGVASAAVPMGHWIDLARPAKVGVQAQWTTGAAPVIHLADQAGAWRAPAEQLAESGETAWIDLPQGLTWVAMMPADQAATQQVWVASWLPNDAAPAAASAAA